MARSQEAQQRRVHRLQEMPGPERCCQCCQHLRRQARRLAGRRRTVAAGVAENLCHERWQVPMRCAAAKAATKCGQYLQSKMYHGW